MLTATVLMQLLMTLSESLASQPHAYTSAIGLKTRTPLMILLAVAPVGLVVAVKYYEGEDDIFVRASELVALAPEIPLPNEKYGKIPQYQHDLLREDWMPTLHYLAEDEQALIKVKSGLLSGLFTEEKIKPEGESKSRRRRRH